MILSDGIINPFSEKGVGPSVQTSKMIFSSYKKESTESAYSFVLRLESPLTNVIGLRFKRINYSYARTAVIHCAYLQFTNLPMGNESRTMNDETYVAALPIQDGTGTVLGSYAFQSDYTLMFRNDIAKISRLDVKVMREDSTNDGFLIPFSDLTYLQVEMEVIFLDNRIKKH